MSPQLRLVVHTDAVAWGGAEIQLASLLRGLPPDVRVHVVGGDPDVVGRLVAARHGTAGAVVPTPESSRDLRRLRALRAAIAAGRPDVVHVNLTWTGGNRGGVIAALAAAPGRVVAVDHLPGPLPTAAGLWLARRLARRVRAYVSVGADAARMAEHELALPPGAVRVVPNGIPDPGARPAGSPDGRRPVVGTVCRLERQKGVDVLVTALAAVPAAELVVVGTGSEQAGLARLAERLGVDRRVRTVGQVEDVSRWLRQMDVFVSASRADGLPLAVLEAMAAGLPVVATDVGSVREAVRDGETGLLVPPADPAALAAGIRSVTENPLRGAAMGRAGRRRALAEFGVGAMVDRYLAVYETVRRGESDPAHRPKADCRLAATVRRAAARGPALPAVPPVALREVEVSRPLPTLTLPHREAAVLARLHGEPLGWARLRTATGRVERHELAEAIWAAAGERIREHRRKDGAAVPDRLGTGGLDGPARCRATTPSLPPATVVVATRGRPDMLARCLESILDSDHPNFSVVVADNNDDPTATRRIVADLADARLRVVAERRPGTSAARNTGVRHADTAVVAFTDDDAVVDEGWLAALTAPFARDPAVAAATGLTVPFELETAAQVWFERFGGFGRGLFPYTVDKRSRAELPLLFPYSVGALGAGVNLAVRRPALDQVGGLREHLGPGTPTFGGEDLDLVSRLLVAGHRVAYQPAALVRHVHRRQDDAVRLQAFTYGAGLAAQLAQHLTDPAFLGLLVRRAPAVLRVLAARSRPGPPVTPSAPHAALPHGLRRRELLGYLYGPVGLAHAAWHAGDRRREAK